MGHATEKTMTRLEQIDAALQAIQPGWPFFMAELRSRIDQHIESLVSQNNEETRGRIKALRDLMNLPDELASERAGILAAELPDSGSATYP
jgi:hypothetical protein